MSATRTRRRPQLYIPSAKQEALSHLASPVSYAGGALSPDVRSNSPPLFLSKQGSESSIARIGNYLLLDVDTNTTVHSAIHIKSGEKFVCKEYPIKSYRDDLAPYWRVGSHRHINEIQEIILGKSLAYVIFPANYDELHSYIRKNRKLREAEAAKLFEQIVLAICHCHSNGIVLRDLKLRKFVFSNTERTELKLESLDDVHLLDDDDNDKLLDKLGCPAYVSPEILCSTHGYSGKAADIWSLGVVLYTMLIGQYPFHDTEASALFGKIRRGQYNIPDTISSQAKCLIRNLLRTDPQERLAVTDILSHPWFRYCKSKSLLAPCARDVREVEQIVPDVSLENSTDLFGVL